MKQYLDLLVFILGKESRVRHRVLCVVVLGLGSSSFNMIDLFTSVYLLMLLETRVSLPFKYLCFPQTNSPVLPS